MKRTAYGLQKFYRVALSVIKMSQDVRLVSQKGENCRKVSSASSNCSYRLSIIDYRPREGKFRIIVAFTSERLHFPLKRSRIGILSHCTCARAGTHVFTAIIRLLPFRLIRKIQPKSETPPRLNPLLPSPLRLPPPSEFRSKIRQATAI